MPAAAVSKQELASALVDYVQGGAYPTSEDVVSAELPPSALPAVLDGINKERETVKAELRELSKGTSHLDGWIKDAKQLEQDVAQSKLEGKAIEEDAEEARKLRENTTDAAAKVNLLQKELKFNQSLIGVLEQLQVATGLLDKAREAESENELVSAVRELANAHRVIGELDDLQSSRFGGLLSRKAALVREGLVAKVSRDWTRLVSSSSAERRVVIRQGSQSDDADIMLGDTVTAMAELGILETHVMRFYRDLDHLIVGPRFSPAFDGASSQIHFSENDISTSGRLEGHDLALLAHDVQELLQFLSQRFPPKAAEVLFGKLLPNLLTQVVNEQLDPSIPVTVDGLVEYAPSMEQIQDLATFVHDFGVDVPSDSDLSVWIERLPFNWLSRRREDALNSLRSTCFKAVQATKTAERVETQMISSDDVIATADQGGDEAWNDDWDDGNEGDDNGPASANESKDDSKDEEDGDAWGWGDDGETEDANEVVATQQDRSTPAKPSSKPDPGSYGSPSKTKPITQKEMTLRETFAITAVPDTLLDLINAVLLDAATISQPTFPIAEIRTAALALSPIPTLLLALYRATARSFYEKRDVGDILIYNDSQDLCKRLEQLISGLGDHPLARRLPRALETEIKSLQTFSRLAYGREMDSQRTILTDLLSGASGFSDCTNPNNAREYQAALRDVITRMQEVSTSWQGVLSESALKQALGALLSHVLSKFVSDILELAAEPAGISEEESKQLKQYMDQVAQLADLFRVQSPGGEAKSLVHVYTPSWLRFSYLGEILEASLADIRFLWKEAGLSVEFDMDEVVELIEALFAESEYRRDALREIRRSTRG